MCCVKIEDALLVTCCVAHLESNSFVQTLAAMFCQGVLRTIDASLQRVHEALPTHTLMVVLFDRGDPRVIRRSVCIDSITNCMWLVCMCMPVCQAQWSRALRDH